MAVARSSQSASSSGGTRILRRSKVLTTAMDDAEPAATKAVKTSAPKKPRAVKKPAAKKAAAKAKVALTKTTKAKVVKPKASPVKTSWHSKVRRPKPTDDPPIEAEPNEPTPWLAPREPRAPRRSATERIDDPPPATGVELITRVTSAIERELNQIEVIVGGHRIRPSERTEGERRARTLASLARTLSEVARLRAQHQQKADDDDDDAMPRDLDEFRETLARRLEKLLTDPSQPADREPEPE